MMPTNNIRSSSSAALVPVQTLSPSSASSSASAAAAAANKQFQETEQSLEKFMISHTQQLEGGCLPSGHLAEHYGATPAQHKQVRKIIDGLSKKYDFRQSFYTESAGKMVEYERYESRSHWEKFYKEILGIVKVAPSDLNLENYVEALMGEASLSGDRWEGAVTIKLIGGRIVKLKSAQITLNTTIAQLKNLLLDEEGIKPDKVNLLYAGEIALSYMLLRDVVKHPGAPVELCSALRFRAPGEPEISPAPELQAAADAFKKAYIASNPVVKEVAKKAIKSFGTDPQVEQAKAKKQAAAEAEACRNRTAVRQAAEAAALITRLAPVLGIANPEQAAQIAAQAVLEDAAAAHVQRQEDETIYKQKQIEEANKQHIIMQQQAAQKVTAVLAEARLRPATTAPAMIADAVEAHTKQQSQGVASLSARTTSGADNARDLAMIENGRKKAEEIEERARQRRGIQPMPNAAATAAAPAAVVSAAPRTSSSAAPAAARNNVGD